MVRPYLAIVLPVLLSSFTLVVTLEVARFEQDLIDSGSRNCSLCSKYKAHCILNEQLCQCTKSHSTFLVYNRTCASSVLLVDDNNCLSRGDGQDDILTLVDLITPSSSTAQFKLPHDSVDCSPVNAGFYYLKKTGNWGSHRLGQSQRIFSTTNSHLTGGNVLKLKIHGNTDLVVFAGRIIRVDLDCESESTKTRSCLLLKAKGNISDTSPLPPVGTRSPITLPVKETKSTGDDLLSTVSNNESYSRDALVKTTPGANTVNINSVLSIDDEGDDDEDITRTAIVTVGVIICVLIICVSAFVIVRYHRRTRRRDADTNVPRDIVVENGSISDQGVIAMSRVPGTESSEPVYSELPDVVESANCAKRLFPSTTSLNTISEESCIVRNPAVYNTMPKARKNTDPLPVIPPQVRPRTPEPRNSFLVNASADNTRTAKFLGEMNRRGCMSLNRNVQYGASRERSSTNVDMLDDVFFGDIWSKPADDDEDDNKDEDNEQHDKIHRSESFYQQLHSKPGSTGSLYESLHEATKESPTTRFSTLERIKKQTSYENYGLQDDSDRNYHILEPSNQDDVSETGSSVDIDGDWGELPEYHTLEGPDALNDDQGQDSTFAKGDITELSGKSLSNLQQSLSEGDIMKACRKEPFLQRTFSERATCRKKCCIQIRGSCYERDTMKACKKEPSLQRSSSERTPFSSERDIMQACRKGPFLRRSSSERDTMKACRKGPSLKRSSSERDIIYV